MKLINGLNLLSIVDNTNKITSDSIIVVIIICSICILGLLGLYYLNNAKSIKEIIWPSICILALGIAGSITVIHTISQNAGENYYKVTIDPSCSYIEFTENYEIVEQEGEIYTIKERVEK